MSKLTSKLKQVAEKKSVDKEREKNVLMLRTFIKDKFYPFLKNKGWSIDHITMFLQMVQSGVQEDFLRMQRRTKVGELSVKLHLNKESDDYQSFIDVFDMFAGLTVADLQVITEGMNQAISQYLRKENMTRIFDLKDFEKDFE